MAHPEHSQRHPGGQRIRVVLSVRVLMVVVWTGSTLLRDEQFLLQLVPIQQRTGDQCRADGGRSDENEEDAEARDGHANAIDHLLSYFALRERGRLN